MLLKILKYLFESVWDMLADLEWYSVSQDFSQKCAVISRHFLAEFSGQDSLQEMAYDQLPKYHDERGSHIINCFLN